MKKAQVMTAKEFGQYLQISESTLRRWRAAGTGPAWIKDADGKISYRKDVVDGWLTAITVHPHHSFKASPAKRAWDTKGRKGVAADAKRVKSILEKEGWVVTWIGKCS
jgi:hypothetical protein